MSQVDLMEQRGKTVGQKEKEERKKKKKIFFGELRSMQQFLLGRIDGFAQTQNRLFSLQTIFRGEAGEICSVL